MNQYRKFTWAVTSALLLFVAGNALIWYCWTESILGGRYDGGDLARLGYIPGSKLLRKNHTDLPGRHLEERDYRGQPVRVVTIGDSYSNGGGGGKNRYYQDYIASYNQCSVLNIAPFRQIDQLTQVIIYLNNGYLERIGPKYLILSSAERFSIEKLARPMDFSLNMDMEELAGFKQMSYSVPSDLAASFVNDGNFTFLYYSLLYLFSDRAVFGDTFVRELDRPFFSVKNARKLLFYKDDVRKIPLATPQAVARLNDNLNILADRLREKGIRFYFMPCVDKYNLYSGFIVDNPYPRSVFFEELRKLPKRYVLIDTKKMLGEELERGVKDLYYPDDTHWSWKASKRIFSEIPFD